MPNNERHKAPVTALTNRTEQHIKNVKEVNYSTDTIPVENLRISS